MLVVGSIILSAALQVGHDPAELLAVAYTESRWRADALGPSESIGALQINCRAWWQHFKFNSEAGCRATLGSNIKRNVEASIYILQRYRKRYARCAGDNVYACYNGGPSWHRLSKRAQWRVQNYQHEVIRRRELIRPLLNQPIDVIWKALKADEATCRSLRKT